MAIPALPAPFKIIVMGQDIGSNINLHTVFMGKGDSFSNLFVGKILCFRSQSEGFSADIDCIRTVDHCGLQYIEASSRNEQFCLSHLFTSLSLPLMTGTH